jgi:hypothetical protein
MKRIATLYKGLVIGVEEWDGRTAPVASGVDYAVLNGGLEDVDVGWVYDGEQFFDPEVL